MENDCYRDRYDAGRALADLLIHYRDDPEAIVLALPRGGVPIGYEIARLLNVPLDIFIVRKLGVPIHPELAMGAIASGGVRALNHEIINQLRIGAEVIEEVTQREEQEIIRREREYRGTRPPTELRRKTVILVDDGLATGASMRAAVQALGLRDPARIVVAVPVGAADTCAKFEEIADEVICGIAPSDFGAVGAWYDDFSQTTDEEVQALLADSVQPANVSRSTS